MPAKVNIVFSNAGVPSLKTLLPAYDGRIRAVQQIDASGTSQASIITAVTGDIARITVTSGNVFVSAPSSAPTAVVGSGWLVLSGTTLDLGGLQTGDKLAVIDAGF